MGCAPGSWAHAEKCAHGGLEHPSPDPMTDSGAPPSAPPTTLVHSLYHAMQQGNLAAAAELVSGAKAAGHTVDVGAAGPTGLTLLQAAIRSHRLGAVQFVLQLAPPAALAAGGLLGSALHDAVTHRAPRGVVEALLLAGADPNQAGDDGHTAATRAVTLHGAAHLDWVAAVLTVLQDTATVHPRPNFDTYSDALKSTVNSRMYALTMGQKKQ